MKKVILFLAFLLFSISCGTQKHVAETQSESVMILLIDDVFNRHQIDSLCVADGLSVNVNEWIALSFLDDETQDMIYEYVYIKEMKEDEIMYRIIVVDEENFKINKRLTNNYPL